MDPRSPTGPEIFLLRSRFRLRPGSTAVFLARVAASGLVIYVGVVLVWMAVSLAIPHYAYCGVYGPGGGPSRPPGWAPSHSCVPWFW